MRLPAMCRQCGARVELRMQGDAEERSMSGGSAATRDLPTAWCDPGTFNEHQCTGAS